MNTPMGLRIKASLLGGLIGAVTPALFVFNPDYILSIQSRFHFNYPAYAGSVILFFVFILLLPCILSTFLVYPWLYQRLKGFITKGEVPDLGNYAVLGILFGLMATFATAFFFTAEMLIVNLIQHKPVSISEAPSLLLGGTFLVGIVGLFFFPAMVITGAFYAWLNYKFIKRRHEVQ
jgi:hypothetical protein